MTSDAKVIPLDRSERAQQDAADRAFLAARLIECVGPLGGIRRRAAELCETLEPLASTDAHTTGRLMDRERHEDSEVGDLIVGACLVPVDAYAVVEQAGKDLAASLAVFDWRDSPQVGKEVRALAEMIDTSAELRRSLDGEAW